MAGLFRLPVLNYPMSHSAFLSNRTNVTECLCDKLTSVEYSDIYCEKCNKSWISHGLDKLYNTDLVQQIASTTTDSSPIDHNDESYLNVITRLVTLIFCSGSLQAVPIRVKILLDRLLSRLPSTTRHVLDHLLHSFEWTREDYARGYIMTVSSSSPLTNSLFLSSQPALSFFLSLCFCKLRLMNNCRDLSFMQLKKHHTNTKRETTR